MNTNLPSLAVIILFDSIVEAFEAKGFQGLLDILAADPAALDEMSAVAFLKRAHDISVLIIMLGIDPANDIDEEFDKLGPEATALKDAVMQRLHWRVLEAKDILATVAARVDQYQRATG